MIENIGYFMLVLVIAAIVTGVIILVFTVGLHLSIYESCAIIATTYLGTNNLINFLRGVNE